MTVVVSDTSPLSYLIEINCEHACERARLAISQICDPALEEIDPGERQAIQLAMDEHADLVLMDDRAGVRAVLRFGLEVTGTLGVLLQAAKKELVDLESALRRLQTTAFRCTPGLIEEVRRRSLA